MFPLFVAILNFVHNTPKQIIHSQMVNFEGPTFLLDCCSISEMVALTAFGGFLRSLVLGRILRDNSEFEKNGKQIRRLGNVFNTNFAKSTALRMSQD